MIDGAKGRNMKMAEVLARLTWHTLTTSGRCGALTILTCSLIAILTITRQLRRRACGW